MPFYVRTHQKSLLIFWHNAENDPFWTKKVHGFPVRTPICHIVPISRIYPPSPPSPISGQKAFSRGGGWGWAYILRPRAAGILYAPPPFYTPATPRRVFSGVGGWGCIKIGPVLFLRRTFGLVVSVFLDVSAIVLLRSCLDIFAMLLIRVEI